MSEENKKEVSQEVELENLKLGYEQIRESYRNNVDRMRASDEKLNMVLVFNAAIVALLIAVLPIDKTNCVISTLTITFLSFFIGGTLLALVSIVIGIFPRSNNFIDSNVYTNMETYNCSSKDFFGKFIASYKIAIESVHTTVEKKHIFGKIAMITTIVNIVLMVVLLVLKII